jgi:hypothetical protein
VIAGYFDNYKTNIMIELIIIAIFVGWFISIIVRVRDRIARPHVEQIERQLRLSNQKMKRESEVILIGPDNLLTIDALFEMIKRIKETNTTIIITDPDLLNDGMRRQIHIRCQELDVSSRKVMPSGPSGLFMVIEPRSPFVMIGMTVDDSSIMLPGLTVQDLELFVRLAGCSIDKKLLTSRKAFQYKLSILDEFHLEHGNPGSPSPKRMFELFIGLKRRALDADQDVITFMSNISKQIEDYIKGTEQYKAFNESKEMAPKRVKQDDKIGMHSTNPYRVGVNEFWGISIDIKSANYNVLRLFDPQIVGNTTSWSEFVKMFTDDEFLMQSKPFRQETLGKLNASRIATRQKMMLATLVTLLQNATVDIDGNINSDELIIPVHKNDAVKLLEKVKQIISQTEHPEIWRVDLFRVRPILSHPTTAFYPFVRDTFTDNGKFWSSFACTPKLYMTQVIKYYMKKPIERGDLLFGDEFGNIHTFDYPIIGKVEN